MKISDYGLALIQRFEGLYLKAYQDRVGVWTIGYGTTNADKSITGTTIKQGLTINKATAETWLRKAIDNKYAPMVAKYDGKYHWTQNEYDALLSFAYNIGSIDKLTDNGNRTKEQIAKAMLLYNKAGGKVVKGLTDRRQAEHDLFCKGSQIMFITTITSTEQATEKGLHKWIPRGETVKEVQRNLARLGYDVGGIDGICGKKTVAAIMAFQTDAGLVVDGLCGAKTWDALLNAKAKPTQKVAQKINYRSNVEEKAKVVYPSCVGKKHGSGVQKRVKSFEQFKKQRELNCHLMVTLTLQEAGCLPVGCAVTHTKKASGKNKITDAVKGTDKLKHCKVYWVNKCYKDLPEKWKKAGCVYIQNSNACISAGNGKIWSCNKSVGEKYKVKGDYLRTSGYPFTSKILVVIVPDEAA